MRSSTRCTSRPSPSRAAPRTARSLRRATRSKGSPISASTSSSSCRCKRSAAGREAGATTRSSFTRRCLRSAPPTNSARWSIAHIPSASRSGSIPSSITPTAGTKRRCAASTATARMAARASTSFRPGLTRGHHGDRAPTTRLPKWRRCSRRRSTHGWSSIALMDFAGTRCRTFARSTARGRRLAGKICSLAPMRACTRSRGSVSPRISRASARSRRARRAAASASMRSGTGLATTWPTSSCPRATRGAISVK